MHRNIEYEFLHGICFITKLGQFNPNYTDLMDMIFNNCVGIFEDVKGKKLSTR